MPATAPAAAAARAPEAAPRARLHNPQPAWRAAARGIESAGSGAGSVAERYAAARVEIDAHGPAVLRELAQAVDAAIARWGAAWSECERNSRRREVLAQWDRVRPAAGPAVRGEEVEAETNHESGGTAMAEEQQASGEGAAAPVVAAAAAEPETIDLVVPLGTGSQHGDMELRYHMRSALQYVRGLRLIHVIGPRQPAWLVTHPKVRFHRWKQLRQKNHDIVAKFIAAAGMADVSDTFLAGSDDWVFLAPVRPGVDWGAVQDGGQLSNEIRAGYWKRCQASTRLVLAAAGKGTLHYDTHAPSVMTKAGWLQVEKEVAWRKQNDHAVWSLYHNTAGVHGPVVGLRVKADWHAGDGSRKPKNAPEIVAVCADKWFMAYNDGGLTRDMQAWLAARFPTPAPWEGPAAGGNGVPAHGPASRPGKPTARPLTPPRRAPAGLGVVTSAPAQGFAAAVAVSCHAPYIPLLRACLTSIDRQTLQPTSKLVCLDSVPEVPEWLPREFPHWRLERGEWRSPNPQRNLGWQSATVPWVWYMDADNQAHPEYLAGAAAKAADHVGIVHADLAYTNGRKLPTPEGLDYWGLRLRNYVDTAAVWRRDAIREAGGWRATERWDDWDLALRVTAAGWHTARNRVPILFTVHPRGEEHRNAHGVDLAHKWGRSYGVVSLLAGRKGCWPKWRDAFLAHEFPERCCVYLVDDSHSVEFGAEIAGLRAGLEGRGLQVQVLRPNILPEEAAGHWDRHRRVCRLYNAVVPRICEDVTWTWEDDNVPRTPDAGRQLCAHWQHTDVGGICAMYETRAHPGLICGSPGKDHWGPLKALSQCRGKRQDGWGFLPGGFAMFHTPLVLAAMPFAVSFPNGKGDSWDGKLSRTVRAAGFRLDLDGSVEVDHLFREG